MFTKIFAIILLGSPIRGDKEKALNLGGEVYFTRVLNVAKIITRKGGVHFDRLKSGIKP